MRWWLRWLWWCSMLNDLWLAIGNKRNHRPHPGLMALLYAYCPTAAYWYQAGGVPQVPFDPVWAVLSDQAENPGKRLTEILREAGLGALENDIKAYMATIHSFRTLYPAVPAPERSPIFNFSIPLEKRFGLNHALERFGGKWEHLLDYVWAWAFLIMDWLKNMKRTSRSTVRLEFLPVSLGDGIPAFDYPFWVWSENDMPDAVTLVSDGTMDTMRRAILDNAVRPLYLVKETHAFVLDRNKGTASSFNGLLSANDARSWFKGFIHYAKNGPFPPLRAADGREACSHCAFAHLCYLDNKINPQLAHFTEMRLAAKAA